MAEGEIGKDEKVGFDTRIAEAACHQYQSSPESLDH